MDREWNKHKMKEKMVELMHILEAMESGALLEDECRRWDITPKEWKTSFVP